MRRFFLVSLSAAMFAAPGVRADIAHEAEEHGDIEVAVTLDPAAQSGHADASVRIHAEPAVVAALIQSCREALEIVPGLSSCEVLETAPDRSWQIIRQVEAYSWYLPKLTYEFRATWVDTTHVTIERVSGDLRVLKGSWQLDRQGDDTIAHYDLDLAPGIWVPHWMVTLALRHDLPKMLRALRARAEAVQRTVPGRAAAPAAGGTR